jgi:hypothetical protein
MEDNTEREPPEVITSDTENATKIHPDEASPDKRRKFRKFRAYNTGTWNGPKREHKDVVYNQDNLHRYDSIASALSLTDFQKRRGRELVPSLDFRKMGMEIDQFLFALCILVVNDDVRDGSRYYPHPKATGDPDFEKVGSDLNLDREAQISAVEKVREETDFS